MAYVTIYKDITKVQNTFLGLSYIQMGCIAIGAAFGFITYFLTEPRVGSSIASLLLIIVASPFIMLGIYKDKTGKNAFELLPYIMKLYFLRPGERPYISDNMYVATSQQGKMDAEIKKIVEKDKTEQRKVKKRQDKLPGGKNNKRKTSKEDEYVPSKKAKKELEEVKSRYRKNPKKPKSAQDTIPYLAAYKSGIMQITDNYYTKTLEFNDISYTICSASEKAKIFDSWCNLLNSYDPSVHVQISYVNQDIDKSEYMDNIVMEEKDDGFNGIRREYSEYLKSMLEHGNNGIIRKRYITVGVHAESYDKAKITLGKVCSMTVLHFQRISVEVKELNGTERLNVLWNILHPDINRMKFNLKWEQLVKTGNTTKDIIAPSSFDFKDSLRLDAKNYFKIGRHIGSCSYIDIMTGDYPDSALQEILSIDSSIIVTMHVESIDQQEALRFVRRRMSDIDKKKIDEQKRAANNGYDMDILPPELKLQAEDAEHTFRSLSKGGGRLFHVTFTIVQMAKTKKELDNAYNDIKSILQAMNCNAYKLSFRQEQALMSALPLGVNQIDVYRGMETSEIAVFLPFHTKELFQMGFYGSHRAKPIYYGLNALSNQMIMADRKTLKNPNGIILGVPGSGKSFAGKREILNSYFNSEDDILILDPEGEYTDIVRQLNGQVIKFSLNSATYTNPMELNLDLKNDEDSEYDPISQKTSFITSLLESMLGGKHGLTLKDISIIDTATRKIYAEYIKNPLPENMLVLEDLYNELSRSQYPEGRELAVTMEMYVHGSYKLFNHRSNIDISNRIVCFNIKELKGRLKDMAMLIIQELIWNRVTVNRAKKRHTRLYLDEFHLLLKEPQTADYSIEMWKRFRKWGGIPTGLTQNVTDFLKSKDVENIFANSPFVLLLSQNPSDAEVLAEYYGISDEQLAYCKDVPSGHGLIIFGGNCILPFKDDFPTDTLTYSLLTSKMEETGGA